MKIEVLEWHETYHVGMGCSPIGCPGHNTDMPVAIEINGVEFRHANEYDEFSDEEKKKLEEINKWITKRLQEELSKNVQLFEVTRGKEYLVQCGACGRSTYRHKEDELFQCIHCNTCVSTRNRSVRIEA